MDRSRGDDLVPDVRRGVRLGVDVGDVRIGVAKSDPAPLLATPVETVAQGSESISRLLDLAAEWCAIEVVVGLPRSLSGGIGPAADKVVSFAQALRDTAVERGMSLPVRLVDERLTTVSAERMLRERGRKGARRRAVVDQAAAVVILQHAIDTERSTGRPPGQEVGHTT
jgi:putative Holliday junction resolvase